VLDDGFQHRRLGRNADIVLVAAEQWSSQRRLLPAGPWREPARALQRANIVVITRKTASVERAGEMALAVQAVAGTTLPVAVAAILPAGWRVSAAVGVPANSAVDSAAQTPSGDVVAVAGIARPDLFAANASTSGAHIVMSMWFPDHHTYDEPDARRIAAAAAGRAIVTTAKDALKLEHLLPAGRLWVLEQVVRIEQGGAAIDAVIEQALS
jgi:tetraacyldisaccharide 4'-kinase